jgi:hypothetical protein
VHDNSYSDKNRVSTTCHGGAKQCYAISFDNALHGSENHHAGCPYYNVQSGSYISTCKDWEEHYRDWASLLQDWECYECDSNDCAEETARARATNRKNMTMGAVFAVIVLVWSAICACWYERKKSKATALIAPTQIAVQPLQNRESKVHRQSAAATSPAQTTVAAQSTHANPSGSPSATVVTTEISYSSSIHTEVGGVTADSAFQAHQVITSINNDPPSITLNDPLQFEHDGAEQDSMYI